MRANIRVLTFPWLLGSKLRALYQRRKGRDLFDLVVSIRQGRVEPGQIVDSFLAHLEANGQRISRAEMEENLLRKMEDKIFLSDLSPLLAMESNDFDFRTAYELAIKEIVALMPGEPWRGFR